MKIRPADLARRLGQFAASTTGITLGALGLLYILAGFLLVPWLVQRELPKVFEQQFGARASVAQARFNPLLLKAELQDLKIAEGNGAEAIDIGLIRVNFELSSLLRWAWTFSEIRIERPVIHADLDASENLNLARLFTPRTPAAAETEAPPSKPPRLLIQHFAIAGGALRFTDRTLEPAARTQLDPINFEIHDVSTLPDHRGEHRLTARLPGGGSLAWEGRLSLAPVESSARLTLNDGKFAVAWNFLRDHLAIAEPSGSYSLSLRYRMGYSGGKPALSISELGFSAKDLVLAKPDRREPLLRLGTLALEDGSFELESRTLRFNNIRLADTAVNVSLDAEGVPDWSQLARAAATEKPAAAAKPAGESTTAPWQVVLPQIAIGPLSLSFTDMSRVTPLRATLASFEAKLAANLTLGTATQVQVQNLSARAGGIALQPLSSTEALISVQDAGIDGLSFDLQQQRLGMATARLAGGLTRVARDAEGRIALADLFAASKPTPSKPSSLKIAVERFEVAGHSLAFADQSLQPALAYDLEAINASLTRLNWPGKGAAAFDLALRVKQGGSLKVRGSVDPGRETADLRVELGALALVPLDPLLKRDTTLTLASGNLGATGRVQWNGSKSPGALRYTGNFAAESVELRVASDRERLFAFKRLAATDLDADLGENRLAIAHVGLSEPYLRLHINKDKTTNLAAIRRQPVPAAAPAPTAPAAAPAAVPQKPPQSPSSTQPAAPAAMAISVDRISVEGGAMDFSDQSLVLPFTTFIKNLNGSASGLSSAQESRATLRFEGGIAEFGLARAEGTIQPFAPKKFTDIAVSFRNVDLPPMTPYTVTFAGRRIATGNLSLDLQYKVENSKLAGDNKLLLEKFTLGERVESPTAVSLPLDLAIALLTDSQGRIDLTLSVSGDVDNPEFNYGHLVWQAIRTVLTRIVTAPFRALASLFGGNADTLGDIVFDAGGARVLPTELEKLRRVAEGLDKRPQLRLQVQGTWHKDIDARALRAAAVRSDLAAREGTRLAPGEDPGPVGFDNAKTQRALEQMLEARAGANAVAQFVEGYRKSSGREASRVNAALALVGRGSGDRELYVAMHQRLVELQPLPSAALGDLAKARADAIAAALAKTVKFDPARVAIKAAEAVDEAAKNGVPAKLSFEPLR
jgi:uncharacterized protein involved in outer membrane biogenesis